jgi:hypothetical protein
MSKMPVVLLTGMFDMDNYGDLLFPLVAAQRLAEYGFHVMPVAPSAQRAGLEDTMQPGGLAELLSNDPPAAGILVGGGYLLHTSSLDFLEHYETNGSGAWAGAGLWLGATLGAALRDVPIAWNAPGAPHPFTARHQELVDAALRAASYLAVRDHGSAKLLAVPADCPVEVVPDTIAGLARLWSKRQLSTAYHGLLERKRIAPDARLMAVHVRNRSMVNLSPEALSGALGRFASAQGLTPILIAVGASHDDPSVARKLTSHLAVPHVLLDDPVSLQEITAVLAHSAIYVGASLHGYIACAAYDVPGVLVGRPAYHKFSGFLHHIGRLQDLARDWEGALDLAARRIDQPRHSVIPSSVHTALDTHWRSIDAAMREPRERRRAARSDFALALLRAGVRAGGPGWAMQAIVNRTKRVPVTVKGPEYRAQEGIEHGRPTAD